MNWKYIDNTKTVTIPQQFLERTMTIISSDMDNVAKCMALHKLQLEVIEHMNAVYMQQNASKPATLEQLDEHFLAQYRTGHIFRK